MFKIFKRIKPKLSELIPKNFVDIHSHVLPGIDDGAKNVEESILLLSEMKRLGFGKIIATPHTYPGLYENDNNSIETSFNLIRDKIDVQISYGSEYMIDQSLILKAEKKTLLTIKENYVLVELSYLSAPYNLDEIIFQIQINDYTPIIAHPERYRFYHNDFEKYYELERKGCKFQMNLLSITGYYGMDVLKISEKLLEKGYINFVGSDIHNIQHINGFSRKIKINNLKNLEKAINNNFIFEDNF